MGNPIRYSYPGAFYHIVPKSNNCENIFPDPGSCKYYLENLKIYCRKLFFTLHCYCIMSTHIHLLIEQLSTISISTIMHVLNTSYAMYFNKRFNRHGRLFCCKYRASLVDNDSYLLEASRYIHNNPVRAGIVSKPEDYKWSSYRSFIGLDSLNFIDKQKILDILNPIRNKQIDSYIKFVHADPSLLMLNSNLDRGSTLIKII